MANYNRPPPIRSIPLMPSLLPLLRSRSVLSSPDHYHFPWTIHHGPRVMPVHTPRMSSTVDEQMVQPALYYQSPLPPQSRLTSCWSIPSHLPPTHCPPPPVSSSNSHHYQFANYEIVKPIFNFESVFNSWLSYYEPIFTERRRQFNEQNTIHLPHYRNMLLKWLELIRKTQSVGKRDSIDYEMPSSLLLQNELNAVQQYCTNPHITNLVKKKLHSIHKKRRYLQRMRDRRQTLRMESSSPTTCSVVILPSTTGSILDRIRSDILLTTQQSNDHNQTRIDPNSNTNNDNDIKHKLPIDHFVSNEDCEVSSSKISAHHKEISRDQNLYKEFSNLSSTSNIITSQETNHSHYYYQMKTTLRKSIDECQTRLKLLDSLQELRSARLTQAKQQGGLFPYQLDEKFNSDVNEMKDQLSDQIQKLELSYSKVKDAIRNISNHQSKNNYNTITQSEGTCCIHVPDLPKSIKMELFGNYCNNDSSNILRRWQRFYHQADYNFCDFIRIRYAWDKYLKVDVPTNENRLDNLADLELPRNWISPKINDNHENSDNYNHSCDIVTNNQHDEDIVNIDEKWSKYLKLIPTDAHPFSVF
ncbi:oligodendrocyte transcription factor 2 isoform 3 [Schistosoma japonicum]|uniref:Oligodendrocyte transcription factor 2 isoform 3 n=1 Tax=Schistosoma japonicum TaxID=6182 RepID=A0A4Z2CU02_SCHJA|nr:oligodendrocyte transcription factor 2 isoform 3 [Schistosoma japonicum]